MKKAIVAASVLVAGCQPHALPANQGVYQCDIRTKRAQIVGVMRSIAATQAMRFDLTGGGQSASGSIAYLSNTAGNVMVGYLGDTQIIIDKQETRFFEPAPGDLDALHTANESFISGLREICDD